MGIYIQGWRVELAIGVVLLLALSLSRRLGPSGPLLVGAVGLALWVLRPELRERLSNQMRENHARLWLHMGLWHCAIVGRSGRIPRVVRSAMLPVGYRFLVVLPMGLHFAAMQSRAPELAAALGVREVRVKSVPQNARYVEIVVFRSNAFPRAFASPLTRLQETSLWEPVFFGVGQDGLAVQIGLPEHNLLIGGEPGSGKSVALSTIIAAAALDSSVGLTLLDGKQVELAAWADVADRFVGADQDEAVAALEGLRQIMDFRYQVLATTRQRKITRGQSEGLHLLVVDELAFYLRGGKKETRDRFAELLRDLVSRGRAAGIIVVAATQKPSHEVVPTWIRDLFSFRLAMRCTSTDASDTILGQGWAQQGFSASTIDPSTRGIGYLLAEGGVPVLIMTPYLSDEEIDSLADRALRLRTSS
jgi:DNA segregation ATPase FtsK/SpoIIIE-like protein